MAGRGRSEVQYVQYVVCVAYNGGLSLTPNLGVFRLPLMPPRRTLLDDDEDFPMAGAAAGPAIAAPGPIALDFGAPPETLFQQLVRHWFNERHAPDILPVQAEVLGGLLDHIRRQVRQNSTSPSQSGMVRKNESLIFVFTLWSGLLLQSDTVQALRGDPDSSEAEHMRIMLVQTEVERVKFAVRSYIRTRLYKVSTSTHINVPVGYPGWLIMAIYRSRSFRDIL